MNITFKGLIKTAAVGVIAYGAGKLSTLGKLVMVCKDRPEDIKEAVNNVCDMWKTLEQTETEDDTDDTAEEAEEEETAPEIIQVTSAEDEETPEEDQPED